MPPSPSTKLRLIVVFMALAALLGLAYGAFWWIAAERFQSAALEWIEARRAEGYTVGYGAVERDGFPAKLRLTFADPALASPAGTQRWSWSASRMVAEITPWAPLRVTLGTDGPQALTLPGPNGPLKYQGSAAVATASITSDGTVPLREVTVRDLILSGQDGNDAVAAGRLHVDLRPAAGGAERETVPAYEITARASDLLLPARWALPLGERVGDLQLDAHVIGEMRSHPWPAALYAWRDAGGVIEVSELDIQYGPLRLTLEGTVTLDGNGQPTGAFVARGEGLPETLDALQRRGLLKGIGVAGLKLAIKVLSRPSKTGDPGVNVPLTLHDGILSVASFPLLKLPAIRWVPDAPSRP